MQPVPDDVVAAGCGWTTTLGIETTSAWRSGYYEVAIEPDDGKLVITCRTEAK